MRNWPQQASSISENNWLFVLTFIFLLNNFSRYLIANWLQLLTIFRISRLNFSIEDVDLSLKYIYVTLVINYPAIKSSFLTLSSFIISNPSTLTIDSSPWNIPLNSFKISDTWFLSVSSVKYLKWDEIFGRKLVQRFTH